MFKKIIDDIKAKKNLDLYIAIFLAIFVAVINVFDIATSKSITSATLGLLSLIALSLILNRKHYEEIENILLEIEFANYFANLFLKRKYDRNILQEKIDTTDSSAVFLGISFLRTFLFLQDVIEKRLKNGIKFRFIVQKPNANSVKMAAFRSLHSSEKEINDQINLILSRFAMLSETYSTELIDIRVIDYLPPYSIIAFDPYEPTGHMFIRLTSFRTPNEKRPFFELHNKYNVESFEFFANQFESIWNNAEEVNLKDFLTHAKEN